MKRAMKIIFIQMLCINFGMNLVLCFEELLNYFQGNPFSLQWYIPLSFVLISVLASLPSLLLVYENLGIRWMRLRIVIHFLIVFVIVLGGGYLFRWYTGLTYFFITAGSYVIIYAGVWIIMNALQRHEEKLINSALEKFHDED